MATVTTVVKKRALGGEVMLGALFAELIGTMILTGAVLVTTGNAVLAAVCVIILVLVFHKISGGHFNPAVTIALMVTKQVRVWRGLSYVVAQCLGAMLALIIVTQFFATGTAITGAYGEPVEVFKAAAVSGRWEPFMAEALGALIFGLGIGAAVLGKKEGFDGAFAVGGALLLGLVVATLGSSAILNPAVAIGLSAYTNIWTVLAYAIGPVVGLTLGVCLYKLLLWDVAKSSEKGKK